MLKVLPFKPLYDIKHNYLAIFIMPLLLFFFVDSVMSFYFPISVENSLKTNTVLGIIMAVSSITGLVCDLIFPIVFGNSGWKLKYVLAICFSMLFPLFNVMGIEYGSVLFFVLASIAWGIYYELITFSIHEFIALDHTRSSNKEWSILNSFVQTTRITGPILGSFFLTFDSTLSLLVLLPLLLVCLVFLFVGLPFFESEKNESHSKISHGLEIIKEIKYWAKLSKSIYAVFLCGFTIVVVDSAYWTIGGLLSQELFKGKGQFDWVIVVLYSVALIIGSTVAGRFIKPDKSNKLISITMFISGLVLSFAVFVPTYAVLVILFISTIFLGTSFTLNDSTSTNLIRQVKGDSKYIVGFIRLESSLAYIIGPILMGILSDRFDYLKAFSIVGVFTVIIAIYMFFSLKEKVNLPKS